MKRNTLLLTLVAAAVLAQLATSAFVTPTLLRRTVTGNTLIPKLLLWNASASAPRGLYLLRPAAPLRIGELVTVAPPGPLAQVLAARGYLPRGVPLLKHVAALAGQTVCRQGRIVTIDGHAVAVARQRDRHDRRLPGWQGCRTLRDSEVFLLNPAVPDSFDGRYFGPLPTRFVTARAEPLWIPPER